jgi:hypothetical protein
LAVLDLARPYVGAGLRPWQWLAAAATVGALAAWLRSRGAGLREAWPTLLLAAFLVPTYVDHSRDMESDGIHYYSYLRSLLFDGDLDLRNDYELLGWANTAHRNVLPVGAPILWTPFVLVVHLARGAARLFGAGPPNGVEPLYQGAACLATLAYGAAGLFLLSGVLRRWAFAAAAFWATVLCWIGSPLRFYLSVLPGLAHGAEFFAAVLVLRTYLALRDRPDVRRAAWAGAACGLLFLVRSQDGILLSLPAIELGLRLARGPDRSGPIRALLALAGAFVLAAVPQMLVWQAMFGVPLLVPHKVLHGAQFMHLDHPELLGTLFSPRGGLFVNYPAMLLAVVGMVWLAFRDRRYVMAILPALLAGWYLNSTIFDWYHVRRFTGLVPFLAPGLALLLIPVARAAPVLPALLAFFFLRYDLAVDSLRPLPGVPVTVRAALGETARSLAAEGYGLVEKAAPRAAPVLLAPYTGSLLSDGPSRIDLGGDAPLLRLPRPARNFSEPEVEDGVSARWVRDRDARLFLPLARPSALTVTIRARALETVEPQFLEVDWNGTLAGRQEMTTAWADYRFSVPAEAVRAGTNELVLRFDRAPLFRRVRGRGPHEVRPAAIATITLDRAGPLR